MEILPNRIVCLLLIGATIAAAQNAPQRVTDPLFLIAYNPKTVHFDRMPASLKGRCSQLRNHYTVAWVYGHLKTPDAEYFVIDGYVRTNVPEEGYGFTVEIQGPNCRVEPTPSVFFQAPYKGKGLGPGIKVPDQVLEAISSELLERYAKAFGGKDKFLKGVSLKQQEELPPILRRQFELFVKEP